MQHLREWLRFHSQKHSEDYIFELKEFSSCVALRIARRSNGSEVIEYLPYNIKRRRFYLLLEERVEQLGKFNRAGERMFVPPG